MPVERGKMEELTGSNLHQHEHCSIVDKGRHEGNVGVVENLGKVLWKCFHLVLAPWLLSSISRQTDVERPGKRTRTTKIFVTIS